jgi:hypothetical protein
MKKLSNREETIFRGIAMRLDVDPQALYDLVNFESRWNPFAKNPNSSARGILQWINARARDLGYADSEDLVKKNPTVEKQMLVLEKDLKRYKPFPTLQSLVMTVFYPAARDWPPDKQFPDTVRQANPGIDTPRDYLNYVYGSLKKPFPAAILVAGAGILLYFLLKR